MIECKDCNRVKHWLVNEEGGTPYGYCSKKGIKVSKTWNSELVSCYIEGGNSLLYKNVSRKELKKHLKNLRNIGCGLYNVNVFDNESNITSIRVSVYFDKTEYCVNDLSSSLYGNTKFVDRYFDRDNLKVWIVKSP